MESNHKGFMFGKAFPALMAFALGVGLIASSSASAQGVPRACGMTDDNVDFGAVEEDAVIRLGRHDAVRGDRNWDAEMNPYVGRLATVTELVGVDDAGCPVVHVDVDDGAFEWRLRNARFVRRPDPERDEEAIEEDEEEEEDEDDEVAMRSSRATTYAAVGEIGRAVLARGDSRATARPACDRPRGSA